jgi:glycine/D-amino acid oxidase-like deaminating enzyme
MTVHIIGAGLAGLSCALASADAGHRVVLHESARQAGGRCRSWYDPTLERVIDNGTHMVVGANLAVFSFLRRIGAEHSMAPGPAAFPMLDLTRGKLWTATPAKLIGSILASTWRLPRRQDSSIGAALGRSRNYRRFWDPLALAIMNTPADQASALVFRRVLARTLWRGSRASQPFLARNGLSESFVAPALVSLAQAGVALRLNHPLRAVTRDGGRASQLCFDDGEISLAAQDRVVLATSGSVARGLLPELPDLPVSPIINAHFRLSGKAPPLPGGFIGLLGGMAQWLFVKDDLISVTVSGAGEIVGGDTEDLARLLWQDVARALSFGGKSPIEPPLATRVIKEKRATLWHSPSVEALRPAPRIAENLILAGDWTATGLPCTLEGALTSGATAARLLG